MSLGRQRGHSPIQRGWSLGNSPGCRPAPARQLHPSLLQRWMAPGSRWAFSSHRKCWVGFFPSPWHRFAGVRRDGETDLSPAGVNPPCSRPISVGCGGFSACFPLGWVVLAPLPVLCRAVPWPARAQAGCSVPCLFRKGGGEGVGRETCLPRYLVSHTQSLPGPRETSIHCAAGICSESKQWDPQRQQCPIVL